MNKKIVIYTPYDCLVKVGKDEIELNLNEHLEISSSNENIFIYPIDRKNGYSFTINPLSKEDGRFYSKIEKDDKILIFLLEGFYSQSIDIYSYSYKENKSQIEIGQNSVTFTSKHHKKIISFPDKINLLESGNFNFINYVILEQESKKNLLAYNILTNKLKLFKGDNIELTNKGFKVTKIIPNIYDKVSEEYYVDEEGLKIEEKVFAQSSYVVPDALVPYKFMTEIKNNDYDHAFNLLSENLKNSIDKNALKEFFGDISYFYMLNKNSCFAISNNKNMLYEFSTEKNKINEINDYDNGD